VKKKQNKLLYYSTAYMYDLPTWWYVLLLLQYYYLLPWYLLLRVHMYYYMYTSHVCNELNITCSMGYY